MGLAQLVQQFGGSPHRLFRTLFGLGWNYSLGEDSAAFAGNNRSYLCSAQVHPSKNLKLVSTHAVAPSD